LKEGGGILHIKTESLHGGNKDQRDDKDDEKLQQPHQGFKTMLTSQSHEEVEASVAEW
jgi:hypothetical protein